MFSIVTINRVSILKQSGLVIVGLITTPFSRIKSKARAYAQLRFYLRVYSVGLNTFGTVALIDRVWLKNLL